MRKTLFIAAALLAAASTAALAYGDTIKPENWKPCATKPLKDDPGASDWDSIPKWARAPHLVKIYEEPRILHIHGLCNEKFHRIVLCLPGWQENKNPDANYRVCKAWSDRNHK